MSAEATPIVRLFGREQCHLCEQAEQLLRQLGIPYRYVDIDQSAELGAEYGLRIPVLAAGNSELDWPFDQQNVALWWAPNA